MLVLSFSRLISADWYQHPYEEPWSYFEGEKGIG
jgi:hypothetical protein